jgi:hypothetical protein
MTMRAARVLLFATTGLAIFGFWFLARPSTEMTASMREWPQVLWFSATLLTLAFAMPVFGRMLGGPSVIRLAAIAGAGVGLSSVANIIEDGLRIDAAFFLFVAGTLILDIALLALTVVIARTGGSNRWLAVVPGGTLVGILFLVWVGGPIILGTWLLAVIGAMRQSPAGLSEPGAASERATAPSRS